MAERKKEQISRGSEGIRHAGSHDFGLHSNVPLNTASLEDQENINNSHIAGLGLELWQNPICHAIQQGHHLCTEDNKDRSDTPFSTLSNDEKVVFVHMGNVLLQDINHQYPETRSKYNPEPLRQQSNGSSQEYPRYSWDNTSQYMYRLQEAEFHHQNRPDPCNPRASSACMPQSSRKVDQIRCKEDSKERMSGFRKQPKEKESGRTQKKSPSPEKLCRFGDKCFKEGCLFGHPTKEPKFIPRYPKQKDMPEGCQAKTCRGQGKKHK